MAAPFPASGTDAIERRLDALWAELTAPGAPYEVATVQVAGRPVRGFVRAPATLREVWLASAAFGERAYLVFEGERVTYGEAHAAVASIAGWLHRAGVRPGDRVAIAMRNYPEWLLIYWACVATGVAAVGMNAWWAPAEMAAALADASPTVLFCDAERLDRLAAGTPPSARPLTVAVRAPAAPGVTPWSEVVATPSALPGADILPDDDACIFYTSGTTGAAKGAQLTHRGCINNLKTMAFTGDFYGRQDGNPPAAAPPPVALVTTPLFHVTANNCLAHPVTAAGGTIVLMRKWDARVAIELIERERITRVSGVPTIGREIVREAAIGGGDLSSLRLITGGGAPLPPDLVEKIDALAPEIRPSTGLGMTETCGIIAATNGPAFLARPTACGRVMPTFEVRLLDDHGRDVPDGGTGELCVRGAGVIKGYLGRPDATAETIVDGWLHTGDVARLDAWGNLYIVDRKKDMVLRGGENVYCAEVEAALFRHPDVAEACVFGLPDERLGEEVGAAIVLAPGSTATADDVLSVVRGLIAKHKVPSRLWLVADALPRNASGKPLRRELKARFCPPDPVAPHPQPLANRNDP